MNEMILANGRKHLKGNEYFLYTVYDMNTNKLQQTSNPTFEKKVHFPAIETRRCVTMSGF